MSGLGLGLGRPFRRSGSAPPPPPLPESLVAAVAAVVQSDLVATGQLTWFGSGLAPQGTPLPYCSFADDDEATLLDTLGGVRTEGQISAQVFAPDKLAAYRLGRVLSQTLAAAWAAGRLTSTDGGNPTWWWAGPRSSIQDPDDDEDGNPVWIETRIFEFKLTTQL